MDIQWGRAGLPVPPEGAAGERLDVFCTYEVYCEAGLGLKDVPGQTLRFHSALPLLTYESFVTKPILYCYVWSGSPQCTTPS